MRNVIHVFITLLMICGKALALSGLFTFFHWLLSLMGAVPKPTLATFLAGAAVLAAFFILRGIIAVIKLYKNSGRQ